MGILWSIFCDKDRDIREYRRLMINVVSASSKYPACEKIKFVPANCPAEVRFVTDIKTAIQTGSPPETAMNPKVKETGR